MKKIIIFVCYICCAIQLLCNTTYAYTLNKIIGDNELTTTVNAGDDISIRYNDIDGFKFKGWTSEGVTLPNYKSKYLNFTMPANDAMVEVNLDVLDYTITYNLEGGTATGNPTTYNINSDTIVLNQPTREWHIFKGWTGSNGGVPTLSVEIPHGSTGNKIYTANWVEVPDVPYTVYHYLENPNDTGYSLELTDIKYDKPGKTINVESLKRTNGNLAYASYSKGSATAGGSAVTSIAVQENGAVYLYYTRNTYTLTLVAGTHISSVSGGGTYKWGASVNISATLGSEAGYEYTFSSWKSSKTSLLSNQGGQSTTITMPKGELALTANATRALVTVRVYFEPGFGTVSPKYRDVVYNQSYGTLPTPVFRSHDFLGWYLEDTLVTAVSSSTKVSTMDTHTLYASWDNQEPIVKKISGSYAMGFTIGAKTIISDPDGDLLYYKKVIDGVIEETWTEVGDSSYTFNDSGYASLAGGVGNFTYLPSGVENCYIFTDGIASIYVYR